MPADTRLLMLFGALVWVLILTLLLFVVANWRIFAKAGRPGWPAVVPVYNGIVTMQVAGKPGWWLALYLAPLLDLWIHYDVCRSLAAKFGKSKGFGAGLFWLPFVFWPVLADGPARYAGVEAPRLGARGATLLAFLIYYTLAGTLGLIRTDPLALFALNAVGLAGLVLLWCKRKWGGYVFLVCSLAALVMGLALTHRQYNPGLAVLIPTGLIQGGVLAVFAWVLHRS